MQPTSHLTQVDPSNNFQGKVVCVTGANGGIGKVITQAFARAGASVWALDIQSPSTSVPQPASPQTDPNTPSAPSLNIHSLLLDVRAPEQWKHCVDQVLAIDKKIDVLIQCASVVKFASIESTSLADWRNVLEINLDGVFLGIKTILPIMKKQRRGVLLQIGSYLASRPSPGLASYCVSKAAVETLTRTAALEAAAASPDIRVNAILPGGVKTGIWKSHPAWNQLVQVGKSENAAFQALANSTPQKRFAEPEEIAQLSLYLASDAARFVTGALWSIDGGITA
jgi:NAD(P)-dependent dehydrogenase (short-subunit alcohol dehydrogenase family)